MVSVPTAPPMVVTQQEQEALERPLPNAADAVPTVSDAFEEMVTVQPRDREGLEGKVLVVLDAANIGFEYGRGQGGGGGSNQGRSDRFDPSGIEQAINYFYNDFANAVVTAFIPAAMVRRRPQLQQGGSSVHGQNALMQTDELDRLEHLVRSGVLIVVPAGDDDDTYAIAYARLHAGFLVSNDHYDSHARSLSSTSKRASLQAWLKDNRCGYTFAPGGEFMPNPGSALVASLRVADSSQRLGALTGLPSPLVRALESLDAAAEALLVCSQQGHGRASLLHVLMARVALRFDLGFAQECFQDCLACLALVRQQGVKSVHTDVCTQMWTDVPK